MSAQAPDARTNRSFPLEEAAPVGSNGDRPIVATVFGKIYRSWRSLHWNWFL
jgi:hypothetical protein